MGCFLGKDFDFQPQLKIFHSFQGLFLPIKMLELSTFTANNLAQNAQILRNQKELVGFKCQI
jgi:hypothetical protein